MQATASAGWLRNPEWLLVWMLRVFGGVTCLAILATILPSDWTAAMHRWLGLGPFPAAPLTEYLTRSIAGLYAIHGGAIVITSFDVRRYAALVTYFAVADGLFGLVLMAIDAYAKMPWYWTALEGPSVTFSAIVILFLQRKLHHMPAASVS